MIFILKAVRIEFRFVRRHHFGCGWSSGLNILHFKYHHNVLLRVWFQVHCRYVKGDLWAILGSEPSEVVSVDIHYSPGPSTHVQEGVLGDLMFRGFECSHVYGWCFQERGFGA